MLPGVRERLNQTKGQAGPEGSGQSQPKVLGQWGTQCPRQRQPEVRGMSRLKGRLQIFLITWSRVTQT